MSTKEYFRKRDFSLTPEPRGGKRRSGAKPIFVVQHHDATAMHYDFRIEVDGVLKSWAVPKGPSTDPRIKRLAIPTEDHPIEYANFEGLIPENQYGAGPVIVWDRGTYENVTKANGEVKPARQALADGHIVINLHGKKLTGAYILQRAGKARTARWFLIKGKDEYADARRNPVATKRRSVLSNRTLREIAR
jgi:DNA ligase D-like protein (predicted 3'-phosphoesterase)